MQSARAASRRAQFQLWIFSYTNSRRSSKKRASRLMIAWFRRLVTSEVQLRRGSRGHIL
jgi:hypothetical protein